MKFINELREGEKSQEFICVSINSRQLPKTENLMKM